MASNSLAEESGAEFEENAPPSKIVINQRPRVQKPDDNSDAEPEEIASENEKPNLAATSKRTNLKPDIAPDAVKSEKTSTPSRSTVDEMAEVAVEKKASSAAAAESQNQAIQSLISNKTYFVPIGQVAKRRNTLIVLLIIVLLVMAAVAAVILF